VLKTLFKPHDSSDNKPVISRDELFISTKNGYVPDDSDAGIPAAILLEDLKE